MSTNQQPTTTSGEPPITITTLLKSLRPETTPTPPTASSEDIAFAISNVFTNEISPVQAALLLYTLSLTGLEQRPDVLARCATVMRAAAVPIDNDSLAAAIDAKGLSIGEYHGGLVRWVSLSMIRGMR